MSPERGLAVGLYAALTGNSAVQALLGAPARIYDAVPPHAVFPYATLGRIETRDAGAALAPAFDHGVTLHAWSRYGGRAEALDVIGAMRAALDEAAIDLGPQRRLVLLQSVFSDVFRSGDARTTHGVLRLRAISEPI